MNDAQKKYFITEISKNKGSDTEVMKDDIVKFALECGLNIKKSTAKATIVEEICKDHLEKFYKEFHKYFYVPIWTIAENLRISQNKLNALMEIGALKEYKSTYQEFKGRDGKFDALVFSIDILELNAADLENLYNKTFRNNHRVRIETKTTEEVEELVTELSKIFEVDRPSKPYEHRSGEGQYTYLSIRKIDNDVLVQNKLVAENAKLKLDNAQLKEENEHLRDDNNACRRDVYSSQVYKELDKKFNEMIEEARDLKWKVRELEDKLKAK